VDIFIGLKNNKLHRDDDLPAVVYVGGTQEWYKNGQLHRDNLPAIIYSSGYKYWYKYGICYHISK